MKIFQVYMAKRFLQPFLFGLGVFAILIFLGDLFDKMPRLIRSHAALPVILEYLWLEVPYWSVRVIPMATLLATLYAVTGFVQSGEWIAVQASGFETRLFFRPLLAMAALVTVLSFAAQESILPACFRRAQRLWRDQIFAEWEWDRYNDVMLVAGANRFITTRVFVVKEERMERPILDYYGAHGVVREIDAQAASWDPKQSRWVFQNGVERNFDIDGRMQERSFQSFTSDLEVTPKRLVPRDRDPDEMTILEMRRYMKEVEALGGSRREASAALQAKIAYPFSNLILCALGIPIALKLRRANRMLTFTLALAASFVYLWISELGRALGGAGFMNPVAASWIAPLVFASSAGWFYRRAEEV